jgi:hypothetical protein
VEGAIPPEVVPAAFDEIPAAVQTGSIARNAEPAMPKILAVLIAFGLLAACQTRSEEEDRPIVKAEDCKPRELESGTCVPE